MKNIIQKSIILLATISLCSCSDFLKESSQDEVIPSTIEDLDQLLAYEGYPRRDLSLMPYLDLLDDDVTQYITSSNANPIVTKYSPYIYGVDVLPKAMKRCLKISTISPTQLAALHPLK